jgi:3-phosphoshikimate 1-carboxyvinyltransferase
MSDKIKIGRARKFKGKIVPPPDKSISHRAIMFASLAKGKSIVKNPLMAEDPISTMNAMRMLGVEIEQPSAISHQPSALIVHGKGLHGLKEPFDVINCGNSGTTIRLISGILAGNPFFSVLTGDDSLKQRPMARVINPLMQMGAHISARDGDKYLPISIKGGSLKPISYNMPVASAQVKSCLILAGLYADGITSITEPFQSRDHTERMLKSMGADIIIEGLTIKVKGQGLWKKELEPLDITIPSDFSSSAFFIVAALLVDDSNIKIKGVGINPTRTGLLDVLERMGAKIEIKNIRDVSGEPVADLHCKGRTGLKGINITKEHIPSLIDEFPILCIAATQADGITTIRGAEELRVKESDRIKTMVTEMRKMGVEVEEFPDGVSIKGNANLKGNNIESYGDHRIAMAFSIAALIAKGTTAINGVSSVNISFPGFYKMLRELTH